jgi:HlyD family secretion protein
MNDDFAARGCSVAEVVAREANPESRRRSVMLLVLVLFSAGLVYTVFVSRSEEGPVEYVTRAVSRGTLAVVVTATGTLQPTAEIAVGSEVSGLIKNIFVDFNDTVSAGQVLAEMDTEQLQARVDSARASLKVAEAVYVQAQATAEEAGARATRSVNLAEQHARSRQELETDLAAAKRAMAAVDSAAAQVSSARGSLRDAESALRKAVIRSPIDGIVLSRKADPGQSVAASFEVPVLFQLSRSLEKMLLRLDVAESDIGQVRNGQMAKFRVDAFPRRIFAAEIISVRFSPRTVNNVVAYETILSVANPELLLRPGMTATAEILVAEKPDVLLVPNRALRFIPPEQASGDAGKRIFPDGNEARVWVRSASGPVAFPVTIGLSNGEFTEVVGGAIDAGAEVIIDIARSAAAEFP